MSRIFLPIVTNAALAGLAFLWAMIALAFWSRQRRPLHLVRAIFCTLMMFIFLLRTFVVDRTPWLSEVSGAGALVRWLWLVALVVALVYSVVYIMENNLLAKESKP